MAEDNLARKLAVIVHADIVGSTVLVQQNDRLAHQRMQAAFQRFSATIMDYGGNAREIRGDALVAEFDRASDAVTAALAFQLSNVEFNASLDDDLRPQRSTAIAMRPPYRWCRSFTQSSIASARWQITSNSRVSESLGKMQTSCFLSAQSMPT
jgi:class 3 adenylate cyclase